MALTLKDAPDFTAAKTGQHSQQQTDTYRELGCRPGSYYHALPGGLAADSGWTKAASGEKLLANSGRCPLQNFSVRLKTTHFGLLNFGSLAHLVYANTKATTGYIYADRLPGAQSHRHTTTEFTGISHYSTSQIQFVLLPLPVDVALAFFPVPADGTVHPS